MIHFFTKYATWSPWSWTKDGHSLDRAIHFEIDSTCLRTNSRQRLDVDNIRTKMAYQVSYFQLYFMHLRDLGHFLPFIGSSVRKMKYINLLNNYTIAVKLSSYVTSSQLIQGLIMVHFQPTRVNSMLDFRQYLVSVNKVMK